MTLICFAQIHLTQSRLAAWQSHVGSAQPLDTSWHFSNCVDLLNAFPNCTHGPQACTMYTYIPGAGDDEESWAHGLTPELLALHQQVGGAH